MSAVLTEEEYRAVRKFLHETFREQVRRPEDMAEYAAFVTVGMEKTKEMIESGVPAEVALSQHAFVVSAHTICQVLGIEDIQLDERSYFKQATEEREGSHAD